ncbi:FUSC family protein [Echinimonas agarilytica]|uniref:FUSC family protein n=1 Tax=Echinimonas agarilytica TaxID=1215918 RepID=A0AA41W5S0_9GAMM|nr:FUSC family membrane protein [Echinimonas agarilytica]MCM2679311.1 FUSC family protein [Echinimonas agarilytica]
MGNAIRIFDFLKPPSSRSPLFVTAIKASILTVIFLVIGIIQDQLIIASSMSMGVNAAALADHPSQYHYRLRSLLTLVVCYTPASLFVVYSYDIPWLFLLGLCASTFCLSMASSLGPRFGKISFGALTIAVFTMLSYPHYQDTLLLPASLMFGALTYFVVSTLVHWFMPNFDLEHDNQKLFSTLAKYQLFKARFFDNNSDPEEVRLHLAKLGAQASSALADVRQQLIIRQQQNKHANHKSGYLAQFFKAQVLLERLSSSHILYQDLRVELADTSLPARIQRVMVGLSKRMLRQPRYRRVENYEIDDQVKSELAELVQSTKRLAERNVFSAQCASQLSFLLENLNKIAEITEKELPFPSSDFLFTEQRRYSWNYYWRLFTTPKTPLFRHAARLTACMFCGYMVIMSLPPDSQNYWILLTILFITKPTFSETKQRLLQRVVGTVLGIGVATGLYLLNLPVFTLIVIAGMAKFAFFWYLQQGYSIAVACVSVYVAIILQFYGLNAEALFVKRVVITLFAAGMVFLALRFLWPNWLKQRSKGAISNSLKQLRLYQELVFQQYLQQTRVEDEAYRLGRFHAHVGEATLVEHWQALLAEPRSKRSESEMLYRLTGRLHSYLSHLSALASHRGRIKAVSALPLIDSIGSQLNTQLSQLETYLSAEGEVDIPGAQPQLSEQLSTLTTTLQGDDLLVTFQLLRLNENIQQIRALIVAKSHRPNIQGTPL